MTLIERTAYLRFGQNSSASELAQLYTPTLRELDVARATTRGNEERTLAFLVMLKSFQKLGYFPKPEEVPEVVFSHVRSCLGLNQDVLPAPPQRSRQRYRDTIRDYLRVKVYGDEARRVATEAVAEAAASMDDPADLINVAIEELVKERFELPAFSTLDNLARHVRYAVNSRIFARVDERLGEAGKRRLDALLEAGPVGRSDLNVLKATPKSASKKNLGELQERLLWLESLGDTAALLEGLPNQKVTHLAAQAGALDASELKKVGAERRRAMLACLVDRAKIGARDGLAEMLVKTVGRMDNRGKERLEELHRQQRGTTEQMIEVLGRILEGAAEIGADDAALGKHVRQLLAAHGGAEALLDGYATVSEHRGGDHLPLLWGFYSGQRATLFKVTRSLVFRTTTEDRSLVGALRFVLENAHRRGEWFTGELVKEVNLSFANDRWRSLVSEQKDRQAILNRRHLEVCVFYHLAAELRTGDVCVEGSEKYADYRDQLLSWEECEPLVEDYCRELGLEPTPEGFTAQLRELLHATAEEVDRSYPENSSVVITESGEPEMKRVHAIKPTRAAKALETAIVGRMPERNLIDVLCGTDHHIHWSKHFGPLSGSEPKLENPRERYLIVAFGYGTNLGPVQTARHTRGLVSAHEVGYVNSRHVNTKKLEAAIREVINAYAKLGLPRVWGTGQTAAADGTKVDLYEENLISEYHIRYGGYGGIAYHHISDTYVALFTHFFACGVWEAVYILDGLLKNESDIQPDTVHSDTQGQSAPVFGLSYMLGIHLMPRIRNLKDLIFFRPGKNAAYEHINPLFSATIDWKLIETHWRDLMRVVLSIKEGKVLPSTLLRKLGNYSRKNRLYRAFREVGRVIRTVFLLRYLSNQDLRRQITAATNKAESYNNFSNWLFFGGEGLLAENDPDEQEKRMKFKELLANSLILQNAADMTEVLHSLAQEGHEIRREHLAQLSPYLTGHVKRFGDYVVDLENVPPPPNGEIPALVD